MILNKKMINRKSYYKYTAQYGNFLILKYLTSVQ